MDLREALGDLGEVDDRSEVAREPSLAGGEDEEGAHRDQEAVAPARSQALGVAGAGGGRPADVPLVGGDHLAVEVADGELTGALGERPEALQVGAVGARCSAGPGARARASRGTRRSPGRRMQRRWRPPPQPGTVTCGNCGFRE
jgi:hypothetical protein